MGPLPVLRGNGGGRLAWAQRSEPVVAGPKSVLPFIEDDFAAAQRRAVESHRLLFIEKTVPQLQPLPHLRTVDFLNSHINTLIVTLISFTPTIITTIIILQSLKSIQHHVHQC